MSAVIAIPGRPGFASLLWWFQGPSGNAADYSFSMDGKALKPSQYKIIALQNLGAGASRSITLDPIAQKTFLLVTAHKDGAEGGLHDLIVSCGNEQSNKARSHTLPDNLATLQIVLASCYYADTTRINSDAPLPDGYPAPHFKISCGDQIYLDLENNGQFPKQDNNPDWSKAYALYFKQWRQPEFLAWMASCANLVMGDDHEFWNNYPSTQRWPGHPQYKAPAAAAEAQMLGAFLLYQAVLNADPDALLADANSKLDIDQLRNFEFPAPSTAAKPLSIFMLDTRTERKIDAAETYQQFCKPEWLQQAINWIQQLQGPGLLVTGQSLLEVHVDEGELADFGEQYGQLWRAIQESPHQLALLTGDIHWSRAQVLRSGKNKHVEIVSSALSRIQPFAINADGASSTGSRQWQYTQGTFGAVSGKVDYQREAESNLSHNFAIISFAPNTDGGVKGVTRWWYSESSNERWKLANMGIGNKAEFTFTLK